MPYKSKSEANPALKGIKPPLTLAQMNLVASWADKIEAEADVKSPWAVAISQFKKTYVARDGKWAKRKASEMAEIAKSEDMELPGESDVQPKMGLAEHYDSSMVTEDPLVWVPFGATTRWTLPKFDDVKQAEVADEYKAGVQKLVYSFGRLFENIMWARDEEGADLPMGDKLAKVRGLVDELAAEIESLSPVAEAEPTADADNLALIIAAATGEPLEQTETMNDEEEEPVAEAELELVAESFAESEVVAGSFAENMTGHAIELVEVEEGRTEYEGGPLKLHMALIEPGWGNTKDNNYYPREMLERDAHVFEGGKMYATDHRPEQKSVLTEVADILKAPVGFTGTGAPIALVGIHNPIFAQDVWNRNQLETLHKLESSIIGNGEVREGFTQNGRKGNWVEAIKEGSSDFVTQAGAGGRVLALAESNGGERMADEEKLEGEPTEADVTELGPAVPVAIREKEDAFSAEDAAAIIDEATLPDEAKTDLKERSYSGADEVRTGVERMRDLVETLTGSGQVSGLGPSAAHDQRMTEQQMVENQNEILRRAGIDIPEVSNA